MCRRLSGCAILLGIPLLCWLVGLLWFAALVPSVQPLSKTNLQAANADAIVVLTGGSGRIEEGVSLLHEGLARRMLITGVGKGTSFEDLMKLNADSQGIGSAARKLQPNITLGHLASSTLGNAEEARAWAHRQGFSSLIMVTANYHIPRALLEFRHSMPDMRMIPYPVFPSDFQTRRWWGDAKSLKLLLSEYHKYVVVYLRNKRHAA